MLKAAIATKSLAHEAACFELAHYNLGDIGNGIAGVISASDCQALCLANVDCGIFLYSGSARRCQLKCAVGVDCNSSNGPTQLTATSVELVAGPRSCPEAMHGLSISRHVTWRGHDDDVPAGTIGTILGFTSGDMVKVKFPNGTWTFSAADLLQDGDSHSKETTSKLAFTEVAQLDPWKHGLHGVVGKNGVLMINLLRQPNRFNHSSSLLSQIGIYPVLFPGTDGQDVQVSQESLDDACFAEGCRFREVQALADSHRRALLIAKQRDSDWTAILEDDVVPVTGLPERSSSERNDWLMAFDAAWASLPPNAKLVRLGRCIVKNWETQAWPSQVGMELYSYANSGGNFRVTQWTGFNGEYAAGGCTHAYVVHKSIVPELLSVFPCRCPLDCCFEGFLYNKQDASIPNDYLYNIDTQISPDDAWRESTRNGGFLQNVMQFGVLRQDWQKLPHGITETAKAGAPFELGLMAKVAPKGEGRWR